MGHSHLINSFLFVKGIFYNTTTYSTTSLQRIRKCGTRCYIKCELDVCRSSNAYYWVGSKGDLKNAHGIVVSVKRLMKRITPKAANINPLTLL